MDIENLKYDITEEMLDYNIRVTFSKLCKLTSFAGYKEDIKDGMLTLSIDWDDKIKLTLGEFLDYRNYSNIQIQDNEDGQQAVVEEYFIDHEKRLIILF